jgi:hypothetical protein
VVGPRPACCLLNLDHEGRSIMYYGYSVGGIVLLIVLILLLTGRL